jgi:hypothetical protein
MLLVVPIGGVSAADGDCPDQPADLATAAGDGRGPTTSSTGDDVDGRKAVESEGMNVAVS